MGLNITLYLKNNKDEEKIVWEGGLTHDLYEMAIGAGCYEALWRPYVLHKNFNKDKIVGYYDLEIKFESEHPMQAKDILHLLEKSLVILKNDPERFKKLNPSNKWGTYEDLVNVLEKYIESCNWFPNAYIFVSR